MPEAEVAREVAQAWDDLLAAAREAGYAAGELARLRTDYRGWAGIRRQYPAQKLADDFDSVIQVRPGTTAARRRSATTPRPRSPPGTS